MNLIYRQIEIFKTIRFINSNTPREYMPEDDIFENLDENFEDNNLKNVIKNYKTHRKNKNKDIESSWLYNNNSDKRRKILKDVNGFYNYIPLLNNDNNDDNSIYAKNENEILYHYLYYKTLLCKYCDLSEDNENNKINELCPYSHNILKDFRIIYDHKKDNNILLMQLLINSNLFKIQNYLNYIPMNLSANKINIDTFKIHKCQLEKNCPNDSSICPYYHSNTPGEEPRRPPSLFRYNRVNNSNCYYALREIYYPSKCCNGIFCPFLHSKNEDKYYNSKDFIGEKKTCKGNEKEIDEKEIEKEIENDENLENNKKSIKNMIKIGKYCMCRKCNNIPDDGKLCFIIKCKHFLCLKCFKKIKSENKEKNDSDLLLCPFCGVKIKKKKIIFINFEKK